MTVLSKTNSPNDASACPSHRNEKFLLMKKSVNRLFNAKAPYWSQALSPVARSYSKRQQDRRYLKTEARCTILLPIEDLFATCCNAT
ncbi:hypothetical protein ACI77J_03385 [Pseudomonas sp. O64]|nr:MULTISPECIES: hypothetical protein [unclassified Pseudomonas]MCV2230562.1 hypothetical protein [Pseudomonas sp. AU10]UNM22980.1 hypothetical protein K0P33_08380 [Pseudomonas sp. ArH3a]